MSGRLYEADPSGNEYEEDIKYEENDQYVEEYEDEIDTGKSHVHTTAVHKYSRNPTPQWTKEQKSMVLAGKYFDNMSASTYIKDEHVREYYDNTTKQIEQVRLSVSVVGSRSVTPDSKLSSYRSLYGNCPTLFDCIYSFVLRLRDLKTVLPVENQPKFVRIAEACEAFIELCDQMGEIPVKMIGKIISVPLMRIIKSLEEFRAQVPSVSPVSIQGVHWNSMDPTLRVIRSIVWLRDKWKCTDTLYTKATKSNIMSCGIDDECWNAPAKKAPSNNSKKIKEWEAREAELLKTIEQLRLNQGAASAEEVDEAGGVDEADEVDDENLEADAV